jgi:hypothetical protein
MSVKRAISALAITSALVIFGANGGAARAQPVASASKYCSTYAEEHFGDKNVRTPGGVKCLGVGEYCSHGPGYAAAYRKAGFRCNRSGRLEER